MAKPGAPKGNNNAAKQTRLLTDCLRRQLVQNPNDVLKIVTKLIEDAMAGDAPARTLIFDRVDGKQAPQTDDGDPSQQLADILKALAERLPV